MNNRNNIVSNTSQNSNDNNLNKNISKREIDGTLRDIFTPHLSLLFIYFLNRLVYYLLSSSVRVLLLYSICFPPLRMSIRKNNIVINCS